MKVTPLYTAALLVATAAISTTPGIAAEATTDPVGFITMSVSGGGTVPNPKLSLVSPTLTRPILWQGAVSAVSTNTSGPTTLTVSGAPWTADQFNNIGAATGNSCYVEIVSATNPGVISDITSTTASTITSSDNVRAFVSVGDSIRIRKHVTIADLLGASNSAGLLESDEPTTADEVLIYDGANSVSYFYYTGDQTYPEGWYDSAFSGSATNQVIGPQEGVVIRRKAAGALNIVYSGAVKTGNTVIPIVPGLNVLGTVSAKPLPLSASGLDALVTKSDEPASADEITIYTPTTQTSYFYYTGDQTYPAGWYDSAFSGSAANITITPGTSFVINRKFGGAFNWSLPSPTSF